jgi:hypothetical protein
MNGMTRYALWGLTVLVHTFIIACTPSTQGRTVRTTSGERACTEKPASYTNEVEGRLRTLLPLQGKSEAQGEAIIKSYLARHPGGTPEGEDFNNYLFYVCQMANNGAWSEHTTKTVIEIFMDKWQSKSRAGPSTSHFNSKCAKQLDNGYAVKDRISDEYWENIRRGTFQDNRDTFTDKWNNEAKSWSVETENVLLNLFGPQAKGRFRNAPLSGIYLNNTNIRWGTIQNFLAARIRELELICREFQFQ